MVGVGQAYRDVFVVSVLIATSAVLVVIAASYGFGLFERRLLLMSPGAFFSEIDAQFYCKHRIDNGSVENPQAG